MTCAMHGCTVRLLGGRSITVPLVCSAMHLQSVNVLPATTCDNLQAQCDCDLNNSNFSLPDLSPPLHTNWAPLRHQIEF